MYLVSRGVFDVKTRIWDQATSLSQGIIPWSYIFTFMVFPFPNVILFIVLIFVFLNSCSIHCLFIIPVWRLWRFVYLLFVILFSFIYCLFMFSLCQIKGNFVFIPCCLKGSLLLSWAIECNYSSITGCCSLKEMEC